VVKPLTVGRATTAFIALAFVAMLGVMLCDELKYVPVDSPPVGPPPAVYVYTPNECVVGVSAYFDDQRSHGKGIVIRHNGRMIVLTSSMIFNKDVEYITVPWREWTFMAEILHQNNVWGLVALECGLPMNTPCVELNDDPNIPPLVPVEINGWSASTLEYINDDWVILEDLPEGEDCTGSPVIQNGALVGIIIGMNRIDQDQAIMVGNQALKAFCDQATSVWMDAPPITPAPLWSE